MRGLCICIIPIRLAQTSSVCRPACAQGTIRVDVDIPPPFSMMPKGMLQSTANVALNATLGSILVRTRPGPGARLMEGWPIDLPQI